ncbi:MAG TPA: methyltransferase domain-containing protein [Pseudolabrys sp.]|nr:methyltransferase domain-containing protein [Pseudolabrys sp.]
MNRKQRRATTKLGASASANTPDPGEQIRQILFEGVSHERARKFEDAVRAYRRVLAIDADHAEACNNLGRVLQAQGKTKDASAYYARSLELMPQLLEQYKEICATLFSLLPDLAEALRRQAAAWPRRLSLQDLLNDNFDTVAANPLFLHLLESTPVRDVGLERLLTAMRRSLLNAAAAGSPVAGHQLSFTCALAKQCFINEYVFAVTPPEAEELSVLRNAIANAITAGAAIDPMQLATSALYLPLHTLPSASALLERKWAPAIDDLLNQQVRDHLRERELRDSILRLTPIEDEVSQRVRQQYEENPYPRWVRAAGQVVPASINLYLREQFPTSAFTPINKESLDLLVAGCGTGQVAIASAQKFLGARVLAVDLSLTSLSYAKRRTPADVSARIEYAQADILKLASVDRSFDVIDSSGVLHHMADPFEGWRILLTLLRPGGLMHVGLYSEAGRQDVWAARKFIADRGFGVTPDEIRRCRQELLETPLATVTRFTDFFTTSECRDLLFHVQEARVSIPMLKTFIADQGLKFLGFEFWSSALQQYRSYFTSSGWAWADLDRWHAFESEKPDLFSGMYQFWIQKP